MVNLVRGKKVFNSIDLKRVFIYFWYRLSGYVLKLINFEVMLF